jgi:excisionase family DNA binding protein
MNMSEETTMLASAARSEASAPPEYETKQQLAARLGVSTRTVDNLMTRGLPYLALTGKLRRFPRTIVDAWLRQQEVRRG